MLSRRYGHTAKKSGIQNTLAEGFTQEGIDHEKLLAEFKEFINRGNVIDMAVGIIIGAAFTAIVTSLTDDIINPFIKLITGGAGTDVAGLTIPVPGTENGIDFGAFISAIISSSSLPGSCS